MNHDHHGHGSTPPKAAHGHAHHGATDHAADTRGTSAHVDPVCGMSVATDSPHQLEHAGKLYRFCSEKCRGKFIADPARYLSPVAQPATVSPQPGARYTCPMHPQIRSPDPGHCPICHMTLEPIPEERRQAAARCIDVSKSAPDRRLVGHVGPDAPAVATDPQPQAPAAAPPRPASRCAVRRGCHAY